MNDSSRSKILEMLEKGLINAEQAINLLDSVGPTAGSEPTMSLPAEPETGRTEEPKQQQTEAAAPPFPTPQAVEVPPEPFRGREQAWRIWWRYPLWAGVGITLVGAVLMYLAWNSSGLGFWFACTWFPFLFGVMVMALAWSSHKARWLHVRINRPAGDGPRHIAISFPLPLRLAAWFVRTFRVHIPKLDRTGLDELILALEKTSPDTPFFVEVQDDDDEEQVQVYIG